MILVGFPPSLGHLHYVVALIRRQGPDWRRQLSGIEPLRSCEVLRRAVQRKVICRLGRKMTQIARHVAARILHHQIHVRLLIHVVEKRKRHSKREDADGCYSAEEENKLSLMSRCKPHRGVHREFPSITASFPYSLIKGPTPAACRNRASKGARKGESLSITNATCPSRPGSRQGIAPG